MKPPLVDNDAESFRTQADRVWVDPERRRQKVTVWLSTPEGIQVVNHMDVHDVKVYDTWLYVEFSDYRNAGHPLSALLRWEVSA